MNRRNTALYIILSVFIVAINSSVNYFDPFRGGLGQYATSVGSSTTFFWALSLIAIDAAYVALSVRMFQKAETKRP